MRRAWSRGGWPAPAEPSGLAWAAHDLRHASLGAAVHGGRVSQSLRQGGCARTLHRAQEVTVRISKLESARQSLLEPRARHMRFHQSPSEQQLWRAIRGRRLGVQFRRQVPLGRFIADFFAPEVGVAVEVDGGYHAERVKADAKRDEVLRRMGYRVVRLEAELVMRQLEVAVARVAAAIEQGRESP